MFVWNLTNNTVKNVWSYLKVNGQRWIKMMFAQALTLSVARTNPIYTLQVVIAEIRVKGLYYQNYVGPINLQNLYSAVPTTTPYG